MSRVFLLLRTMDLSMEAKPWILKLGRFLSLPFIVVAAIAMIVWHLVITFWFACCAAYITIRSLYERGLKASDASRWTP